LRRGGWLRRGRAHRRRARLERFARHRTRERARCRPERVTEQGEQVTGCRKSVYAVRRGRGQRGKQEGDARSARVQQALSQSRQQHGSGQVEYVRVRDQSRDDFCLSRHLVGIDCGWWDGEGQDPVRSARGTRGSGRAVPLSSAQRLISLSVSLQLEERSMMMRIS
jgi:hypothetical protein